MKRYLITQLNKNKKHEHYIDEAYNDLWILAQVASGTDASTLSTAAEFLDGLFSNQPTPEHISQREDEVKKWLDMGDGEVQGERVLLIFDLEEQKTVWEYKG